mmetsp:Transcript_44085/g.126271  ORF Transcript_44085/g.126271 Transcript_44085/m.126271 type:complete len:315 (-) Transcript_44085:160-1104(-)
MIEKEMASKRAMTQDSDNPAAKKKLKLCFALRWNSWRKRSCAFQARMVSRPLSVSAKTLKTGERVEPSRRLRSREMPTNWRPMKTNTTPSAARTAANQGMAYVDKMPIVASCEELLRNCMHVSGSRESPVSKSLENLLTISPLVVTSKYSLTGALSMHQNVRPCTASEARRLTSQVDTTRSERSTTHAPSVTKAGSKPDFPEAQSTSSTSDTIRHVCPARKMARMPRKMKKPAACPPFAASPRWRSSMRADTSPLLTPSLRANAEGRCPPGFFAAAFGAALPPPCAGDPAEPAAAAAAIDFESTSSGYFRATLA